MYKWVYATSRCYFNRVKCNLTLVKDQEQVAQFVWRGVALCCTALALGFISILGGCLQRLLRLHVLFPCGTFPWRLQAVLAVSGSFAYYACACACPRGLLGSAFGVLTLVCFLVFSLPPLPIRGIRGVSSIVFPLNSLFSVTGA